jgi:predicted Ser/Thr protein kinase
VALAPGTLVLDGRFRVTRTLGQGGMGIVYAAEQVSLGRTVALKVLRGDLPLTAGFSERFRREALLLSSVEHPAVVRVIDYGAHGLSPVLVMEFVEGETLAEVLRRDGALAVERVERLLAQLAQGLAAIHAKGIVHRDLKPENVVLTRAPDGTEQARLLDFGIARLASPEEEGPAGSVTQSGMVLGTPEYLAPEQGLGQPLDARTDLYALGVILFEALTGRHPFPGPSAREFIAQHIHQAPPSVLDVAPHLAAFPSLVATVRACLEKDPAKRPQTATDVLTLATAPVTPLSPVEAPTPAPRRLDPRVVGGVAAGLALVVALGAWGWWRSDRVRTATRLLTDGRGSEALQVLDELDPKGKRWPVQQLRAAALHQVGRHDDEHKVMGQVPEGEKLEPLALEALADDYGRGESQKLRKLLAGFPRARALPPLQAIARSESRWAQWGALRFIDQEYAGQGLPLLELYAQALEHKDCGVRRTAAKRLAELRNPQARGALERLKGLPKVKGEDCGQAAADAALRQLARE